MKKRLFFLCVICSIFFAIVLYYLQINKNAAHTIKYFPLNDAASFSEAATTLAFNHHNEIDWTVASTTDKKMYLRHDVSLLYENGYFKGVQSKWKQDQDEISLAETVPLDKAARLEAISFHHGEIHQSPSEITSIQQMTSTKMYIKKQSDSDKQLKSSYSSEVKFDQQIENRLKRTWYEWFSYYDIDEENYTMIPLANLFNFQEQPLPNMSVDYSKEVIGKLWEGLYKHYILRLKEKQNQEETHVMPIILLSKDKSHLYIIFELYNQKELLLQQIEMKNHHP